MNKIIIASAGSGKTTYIVNEAIKRAQEGQRVLITTFTIACANEIRVKMIGEIGYIPDEITVKTWFSFLIAHGIKPFQGNLFEHDIRGMVFVEGKSGFRYRRNGRPIYWGERDFDKYYFTEDKKVYSDKVAKLVMRCNEKSDGKVFGRIEKCFKNIFIDEIQDLAGFDLEILKEFFSLKSGVLMVGDPRQATYSTAKAKKNEKYAKSEIVNFFDQLGTIVEIDDSSLGVNFRCHSTICQFANQLFPDLPMARSSSDLTTGHDGIFAVAEDEVNQYLRNFGPVQLRENVRKKISEEYLAYNFSKSKGLTFDRVLIYPSGPIVKWLKNRESELTSAARSKFYVSLTRARYSVGIVLKSNDIEKISDIEKFKA